MRQIGIEYHQRLFYEGESSYGRGIWPSPTILLATVLPSPPTVDSVPETEDLGYARLVFREDSFEPVTRIRRGRLYSNIATSQPQQWQVQPHPACPEEGSRGGIGGGWSPKLLYGFAAWNAAQQLGSSAQSALLALGPRSAYTLWRVLSVERIVTGEDLVTLKARGSLGILPELNRDAVPADALSKTFEVLDNLVQAAHTSGPASVIDRARDASQWCLGVWLSARDPSKRWQIEELGALAKRLETERALSSLVGRAVARLHSRAKPNESERFASRPTVEGDAEFALAAVGLLLREIGWAL
jgi:hypothetical protein